MNRPDRDEILIALLLIAMVIGFLFAFQHGQNKQCDWLKKHNQPRYEEQCR